MADAGLAIRRKRETFLRDIARITLNRAAYMHFRPTADPFEHRSLTRRNVYEVVRVKIGGAGFLVYGHADMGTSVSPKVLAQMSDQSTAAALALFIVACFGHHRD
jgi:hypothetical protein